MSFLGFTICAMAQLLTTQEVARQLGVAKRTVQNWCKDGSLPATKVGRDWLVQESDMKSFSPPTKGPKPK